MHSQSHRSLWLWAGLALGVAACLAVGVAAWLFVRNSGPARSPETANASQLAQEGWQLWQGGRVSEAIPKFQQAVQELAKMRNALQEGKLTPAEREKLRKQMEALAEKMAKDKDLNEVEKKLAQAMKGLQDGDEKDLDGLQKQFGQLDGELNEKEQLAEALKDLENLADALAKGQGECPTCGKKKDGKPGG